MHLQLTPSAKDHQVAALAALAIGIHVLESVLPSPLPGVKPGFANIITLIAYACYGFEIAAWVSVLRVLVGSLIVGTFLSPTFVLSFSGAVASMLVLWLLTEVKLFKLSLFGIAILMAMAHMFAQLIMVYWLFIPHEAIFKLLPILLTASLVFGLLNGVIASKVYEKLSPNVDTRD
ncbi:MAG TPA: Gx transporter family protein [Gammaproteobacteria bacterium]|nr:Gx transporter family protein [Gammaproteobacteria bacterium]